MNEEKIKLSKTASCAGCAAKLSPMILRKALPQLSESSSGNLLVGFDKADDAGVYQIRPDLALVQTVDFFPPIVDDPIWYGRIAAANALSDVYAMGGTPLTALNIFCFPEKLGTEVMEQILRGGSEKIREAQCVLVGGHSIADEGLKYGLAVTGTIHPNRIFSNDKAQLGQTLVLTKKLGTGVITTAAKFDDCDLNLLELATQQMATLNNVAAEEMLQTDATSCTDITGFGFLGHLSEMTRASGLGARIFLDRVPKFDGVIQLIKEGNVTRAEKSNREYTGPVRFFKTDPLAESLLFDPQTSGGLLISMSRGHADRYVEKMHARHQAAWIVGEMISDPFIEVL